MHLRRRVAERIMDSQPVDREAVLHIFREQRVTAGFERCGDNEGIVEGKAVGLGERHGAGVRFGGHGSDVGKSVPDDSDGRFDFGPRALALPACDVGELVEHLRTDDSAFGDNVQSTRPLLDVEKGIDENVGVDETAQRSFASSLLNL